MAQLNAKRKVAADVKPPPPKRVASDPTSRMTQGRKMNADQRTPGSRLPVHGIHVHQVRPGEYIQSQVPKGTEEGGAMAGTVRSRPIPSVALRSVPSVVDGFKPGQRKVLFSCFKSKLTADAKVAQLTRLAAAVRLIFHPNDDSLLEHMVEDGKAIEPEWYLPILPMALVNGSDGIGDGWSSKVPTYDPRLIASNLKKMMAREPTEEMLPWFQGFTGDVFRDAKKADRYHVRGVIEKLDDTTLQITELPVREWTQDYKAFLEALLVGEPQRAVGQTKAAAAKASNSEPSIKDYKEHHTDTTVHFTVTMTPEQMAAAEAVGLHKKFKLESTITTSNMVLFDSEGRLRHYNKVDDIMVDFFGLRLAYYQKRKDWLADKLTDEWTKLDYKVRFILALINETLSIRNRPKKEILAELKAKGFTAFPKQPKKAAIEDNNADEDEEEDDDEIMTEVGAQDYDYLLGMPFWSLTLEKVEKLKSEREEKEGELNQLLAQTPEDIWSADLDHLMDELDELDSVRNNDEESNSN